MSDASSNNLPIDRFSWLGNNPSPDWQDPPPPDIDVLPPAAPPGSVHSADGLGILYWLMGSEEERKQTTAGCPMFDNFVFLELPKDID